MKDVILKVKNLSLRFPGVVAINHINMELFKGEVLGLIGQNGAGKSSLARAIAGVYKPDAGDIVLNGKSVQFRSPYEAIHKGINYINQEPNLLMNLSVADNLLIGLEKSGKYYFSKGQRNNRARGILERINADIDVDLQAKYLTYQQRQLVTIARLMEQDSKVLIMDEPTASLDGAERDNIYKVIKNLQDSGIAIIYISHNIREVIDISDRIMVIRDGVCVMLEPKTNCSENRLLSAMVGDYETYTNTQTEINHPYKREKEVLRVEGIENNNVHAVSFSLYENEVLGFSGLVGSGRTELANVIFGIDSKYAGKVFVDGKEVKIGCPRDAMKYMIGLAPEERKRDGLVKDLSVKRNISIGVLNKVSKFRVIINVMESILAGVYCKTVGANVKIDKDVQGLSGGNQEKIAISKLIASSARILILDEPMRGIDVIGKRDIYKLIETLKKDHSIILISSELEDIAGLLDRMIVMRKGRIVGELLGSECTVKGMMHLLEQNGHHIGEVED